jgi:hypothetical protein
MFYNIMHISYKAFNKKSPKIYDILRIWLLARRFGSPIGVLYIL